MTTLATVRADLATALEAVTDVHVYRRRLAAYQYPALIVGWPQSMDVRAAQGSPRDFVVDVFVAVEAVDDGSSDALLESLLESTVTELQRTAAWDVQPVTDFAEEGTADGRTVLRCRLPVAVFA